MSRARLKTVFTTIGAIFLLLFFGFMVTGKPGPERNDPFELTVSQMLDDKETSQYEIKVTSKYASEVRISSVLVICRAGDLNLNPEFPLKLEALPVSEGPRRPTYYNYKLNPGQHQRFVVTVPKTFTKGTGMDNLEIQVKAAASDEDGVPIVIHSVRYPKVLGHHT